MTESAKMALVGLRDWTTLQWYVVPLLVLLLLVYATEIREARRSGNWDCVVAGLALFSADFVNESINGWIFALSGTSALWLVPGPTALRTMVGWNVEIMFMFALAGIVYYKALGPDPRRRILGLPDRWFWAVAFSAFAVLVEVFLNRGGLLIWDYRWWNRGFPGVVPIFLFGYLWFFLAAKLAIERPTIRAKLMVPAALFGVAAALNAIGLGALGLTY
ncbi:MAG TPA: hypothetical protein VLS93_11460 [Anaeromyxobacteraceae bacterium]|nr:hypothetical protein [Anaeromyxobacteraceae bacterium]